ncbi:hypothetical protein CDD83_4457 [Cordyceps sp. RAO-2017]|nr:hypothetical protein CDD83_4457 [Cordyceps sp. RAO-2017]
MAFAAARSLPRPFPSVINWPCSLRGTEVGIPLSSVSRQPLGLLRAGRSPKRGTGFPFVTTQPQPPVKGVLKARYCKVPPLYVPPTSGILSKLPSSWVPYAELIRINKPTGTYYLFLPCLFSTLMAAPMLSPVASLTSVAFYSCLFFSGALIMRGAGCTINDLWDRNLDPHVERTRMRPVARGAIKPFNGLVFTGLQLLAGLAVLVQFPLPCIIYGTLSLPLVATYPLAKRVTYYPQLILGLTFSWGAIMGFPALGLDLLSDTAASSAAVCLYCSCVAWTVFYDMIYAHMDIRDDAQAGIKSIALRHKIETKKVLSGLAIVQVFLLAAAGAASGAGPTFFFGSCGGAAITLGIIINRVNLKSAQNCWWWFVNGCVFTGGTIAAGLAVDYSIRLAEDRSVQGTEIADCTPEA